jgi:HPt (histidine-containing phosphotransfer) domain-containing protein
MSTLIDEDFFARLRMLSDEFAAGVPATLARLTAVRAAFDVQAPASEHIGELQQILHTVAGSAATFSYRAMGQHARTLEQRLRVLMAFAEAVPARDWEFWLASLDDYCAWAANDPKSDEYPEAGLPALVPRAEARDEADPM